MTKLLVQHLLYHSQGEMFRWNSQKDIAKEQGHGRKSYKVFSLNPLYQFKANVGKISSTNPEE